MPPAIRDDNSATMADQQQSEIMDGDRDVEDALDFFQHSFNELCKAREILFVRTLDPLRQLRRKDTQTLTLDLLLALLRLPALRFEQEGDYDDRKRDVFGLVSYAASDDFDPRYVMPLLKAALTEELDGTLLWDRVADANEELRDYGKPIYKASSRSALLAALEGCIKGHESLHGAGILHRDISPHNLMINEDQENLSWPFFFIDLDSATGEQQNATPGADKKLIGTWVFMAVGVLMGEDHSFMHDLESFFWVLFWICIHWYGPDEDRTVTEFRAWRKVHTGELAALKKGHVSHEGDFLRAAEKNFTPYYRPMIPWANKLRKVVFPNGGRWERWTADCMLG